MAGSAGASQMVFAVQLFAAMPILEMVRLLGSPAPPSGKVMCTSTLRPACRLAMMALRSALLCQGRLPAEAGVGLATGQRQGCLVRRRFARRRLIDFARNRGHPAPLERSLARAAAAALCAAAAWAVARSASDWAMVSSATTTPKPEICAR